MPSQPAVKSAGIIFLLPSSSQQLFYGSSDVGQTDPGAHFKIFRACESLSLSTKPDAHDFDQLNTIYAHLDSSTTVAAVAAQAAQGRARCACLARGAPAAALGRSDAPGGTNLALQSPVSASAR